jgi:hypothetical protein
MIATEGGKRQVFYAKKYALKHIKTFSTAWKIPCYSVVA